MKNILIAAPVRQSATIFELYAKSLSMLEIPEGCEVDKYFIFHNCDHRTLANCIDADYSFESDNSEYSENQELNTHGWSNKTLETIVRMKQKIINYANGANLYKKRYDYIFWVDSDLVIHPKTLIKLYEAEKDIISEIFWTRWTDKEMSKTPNCWDVNHYNFFSIESLNRLKAPGIYQIGGTGALTLVETSVYSTIVSYSPIRNISFWGEDRSFSIRATVAGYDLWIDTSYPAHHIYRSSDICRGKQFIEAFEKGL